MMFFELLHQNHLSIISNWLNSDDEGLKRIDFFINPEKWLSLVDNKSRYGWVAYQDKEPIGFIDLENIGGVGWFSFYISPSNRGKNLSTDLLASLEAKAKDLGFTELMAGVEEDNLPSCAALEKVGFKVNEKDKDELLVYVKRID